MPIKTPVHPDWGSLSIRDADGQWITFSELNAALNDATRFRQALQEILAICQITDHSHTIEKIAKDALQPHESGGKENQ